MTQVLNFVKWLVVLFLVIGLAFLVYAGVKVTRPFKTAAEEQTFAVKSGQTTDEIAKNLEESGLAARAFFFKLYAYFTNSGGKIQAGNYSLSASMSIAQIAKKLTEGEIIQNEVKFTVVEGWTMSDIAQALDDAGLIDRGDFMRVTPADFGGEFDFLKEIPRNYYILEGYLFPDTYLLAKDAVPADIARKMLVNFDKKLSEEVRKKIADTGKTLRQIAILASIIEREVGRSVKRGTKLSAAEIEKLAEERRLVASVFYNRLEIDKALESDATIGYITGRKGSARATLEETKINSPYNTYRYAGLPPGPISNPSLDAIMAAVEPADTDYLYFLSGSDGTAYFAKTLEEHIANREKYLD